MTNAEKTRPAMESLAAARRGTSTPEAGALSGFSAEERGTYAILAAIKPTDAEGAVLRTAQWLAEHQHRELHIVSVVDDAPPVASFAAGSP